MTAIPLTKMEFKFNCGGGGGEASDKNTPTIQHSIIQDICGATASHQTVDIPVFSNQPLLVV